jgi:mycofactocin precursor peptide peptidase
MSSPELADSSDAVLAVPFGATEQHGPHLPLSTDTDIALALCQRIAAARDDVIVAPSVAYGSSGEHAGFPGTLSIGQDALELLALELGRSATASFDHVLFVCAHGGNEAPLRRAVDKLRTESRDVVLHLPSWRGDPHAGRPETSLLLALHPELVDMHLAVAGDRRPLRELWEELVAGGVLAVSRNGVLGDPVGASASEGEALLDELTETLAREIAAWRTPVRT